MAETNVIDLDESSYTVLDDIPTPRQLAKVRRGLPGPSIREKKLKKERSTILNHLSHAITQIEPDKAKVYTYIEAYISNRSTVKENIALAIACHLFHDLNEHEREHTTYEGMIRLVKQHTNGRHIIDPSYFLAAVAGGAHYLNSTVAHAIATTNAPSVVKSMVDRATKAEGGSHADGKLLLEVAGVATKDAPSVVINNNQQNNTLSVDGESLIPKFMGKVLEQDTTLRDHYRRALKSKSEEE